MHSLNCHIRSKDTKPERELRLELFRLGLRYRLHDKRYPGSPDLVFPRYRVAVFVHGCFWHRHEGCRYTAVPKTNEEFWATKFTQNVARDAQKILALKALGWRVAIVWECAIKQSRDDTVRTLHQWILNTTLPELELG